MKFKYVCVDCGKEFITDEIIYQCPECAAKQKEGEFPRGYLKVIYDTDDLRKLAKKDHVTIYDFFPYEVPNKEVYPVGTTPIIVPRRLNEKLGLKNVFCKMDAYLPSGSFKDRARYRYALHSSYNRIRLLQFVDIEVQKRRYMFPVKQSFYCLWTVGVISFCQCRWAIFYFNHSLPP